MNLSLHKKLTLELLAEGALVTLPMLFDKVDLDLAYHSDFLISNMLFDWLNSHENVGSGITHNGEFAFWQRSY
tara:strand:- start:261 stop:479 length:219 start_codon:yes stop_codon:yes gene_type:complete